MNLKQLKLAGFKSFVDPTVVYFPSQLVAIVGPNGCGKSNIIDAVRWVMGESSVRNLRGESMIDVIFNGSSSRKPVGQASVELIFDNSLGRLTGPFASYGEISVKRVVTRGGDSSYYLNGSRCRRKDVTDIFLGTGAGARGYSIIGQGTISQLIEAKPEDLRVYLEEAAGVSKYKERRKETLQRIAHARENLTRVADVRDELDKQLQRLDRQAKAAERYLIYKEEEKLCRAEILALKWQDFIVQQEIKQRDLQELAVKHAEHQSLLTKANKERVIVNEKLHDADEQMQQIQSTFYQLSTEIARLEETIQQHAREKRRLEQDQQQMQEDWQIAKAQLIYDQEELSKSQKNAQSFEEQVVQLRIQFNTQEEQWQNTHRQQAQWDEHWQEVQAQANNVTRELYVTRANADHVEKKKQQTLLGLEKLKLEQQSISLGELQQAKTELEATRFKLEENHKIEVQQLKHSQEQVNDLRLKVQKVEQQLHQLQDDFHCSNSELAALIAAQHAARQKLQNTKEGIKEWMEKPRLMDVLQVELKWQLAWEQVLNDSLNAYVLETFDELWPQRELCARQGESIVTLRCLSTKNADHPRLIDKIQGAIPAHVFPLEYIFAAENFAEALSWLPDLLEYQSIVTPDGFWLGKGWVKFVPSTGQDEFGLLARKQKITDLRAVVSESEDKIATLRSVRDECHQQLQKWQHESELQQFNVTASSEALRNNTVALSTNEQAIIHTEKLVATLAAEYHDLQMVLEEIAEEQLLFKERLQNLEQQCHAWDVQQKQYLHEKQQWFDALAKQKKQIDDARMKLHHTELEYEREKNKIQQLGERIHREQERFDVLHERLEQLALFCIQTEAPGVELKGQLEQFLLRRVEVEMQLTMSREQLSQLRIEQEDIEKEILKCDSEVKHVQELIGQARMQEQALAVRASSVQDSLDESGLQARTLLEHIPEGATQATHEEELIALMDKIKRLGAINLAAIEEFSSEQQRKIYLDEQYNDLSEALATLETAIEKMDKETRLRLENTFDEVNTSFKALFPRLFGGGRAQLELTCDNLLEAGIVVMAQPPGKRNSTIHLLSGGEKAMTAVALVFAIFQLNPSPFCMLDEVDAPLDDVNVGRFCAIVKEMSKFVQFLFITHNKVTMELADHLMGVTMREPGVSRLVAVDVTQALVME
ncbi:MAG: chromosome segregation protein SMC [Legionella sp.]|uniref:chromosome segregation protein SMC n=1 Tax=Legionella sp. TaxID=459 RepID=UPI0039E247F0